EAQWEYAAKAGTTSLFWWGDDFDRKNLPANISDQSLVQWRADNFPRKQRKARWDDSFAFTSPVGHYPANPWGFYDMLGNVSEWCRDWQASYVAQQLTDPQGPAQGKNRVVRGGSWNAYPAFCRSSYRGSMRPDRASTAIGFRVVSEIK
ncbi:MAG TPA: DNA recombination protein RecF, partial [Phycisphaerales bacterium]|nr:DNA recombination protein RecF [Phycisphaerales bacterium]